MRNVLRCAAVRNPNRFYALIGCGALWMIRFLGLAGLAIMHQAPHRTANKVRVHVN